MPKVLVTTIPFGEKTVYLIELLDNAGIKYLINPFNKKITEDQLTDIITDFDAIIAGTATITEKVMNRATNLKFISRVGIGLDSVDLIAAQSGHQGLIYSECPNTCDSRAYTRSYAFFIALSSPF